MGHRVEVLAHTPDLQHYYLARSERRLNKAAILGPTTDRVLQVFSSRGYTATNWIINQEIDRYCFETACSYFGLDNYDLIHAQDVVSSRAVYRVKPDHVPLVTTLHGAFTWEFKRSGIINTATEIRYSSIQERMGAESADKVIVPSNWLRELLHQQFGVALEKMITVPYGVNVDDFYARLAQPLQIQIDPGLLIVLCPARLTAVKGHRYLLKALEALNKTMSGWQCWIVGEGELHGELEKQAAELGLWDCVRFLGSRTDVPSLLKRADVVVLPSLQDNLPFVVIEAQLAGKAIIATNAGGIPEMIEHEQSGIVVPAADSGQLYLQLKRLIDDPALRQSLGMQAGMTGPQKWSKDLMISRTLSIYNEVINQRN